MSVYIGKINNYIQKKLKMENLTEVALPVAAQWLNDAHLLHDTSSTPGSTLRRHVYRGNIFGAFKKKNYFWYIRRIANYDEILNVSDLIEIFGLDCRTSLYRKIRYHNIPYVRRQRKGIYFRASDFLEWALEKKRMDIFEKTQKYLSYQIRMINY